MKMIAASAPVFGKVCQISIYCLPVANLLH